jgi:predicted Zn-dependent protease
VLCMLLLPHGGEAAAAPYVPDGDGVVLERLPERGDGELAALKRMRLALARDPRDLGLAVAVARRAHEAARTRGDPRYLGQAQAALAPWWNDDAAPAAALLARASLKQAQHDFTGALADLDRLITMQPALAQAALSRAVVLAVVGRYADARRDCASLAERVSALVVAGCDATPASLSGDAGSAYETLVRALERDAGPPDVREWALTLAAELAARRGERLAAERHFAAALALDPRDPYLKGAYADFLLDGDRPRDVVALLAADARDDGLLLRLALAEARLPEHRAAFDAHRAELAARFDAARRRGDSLHRREEARFRLWIEADAQSALALARANFDVQREPADLRVLIESARASGDAAALAVASNWIATHRLEDAIAVGQLGKRR